ncbi:hypothetical protein [Bacillus mycoides]|uniref:hypothetical protein n=1 Tax=Bacillus mycoides TaxID=1405 RepID=UPI0011A60322|nr:hypothetical protein [Bacillus mycoides]
MIQIKRENLDLLSGRHYNDYFVKKGFSTKLEDVTKNEKDPAKQKFFNSILDQRKDIITGRPDVLHRIIQDFYTEHPEVMRKIDDYNLWKVRNKEHNKVKKDINKELKKENHAITPELKELLKKLEKIEIVKKMNDSQVEEIKKFVDKIGTIFNYDNFCNNYPKKAEKSWGAYELVKQLKVEVCPYCNRQYITVSEPNEDEEGRTRPQLDHFYSKTRFPYFAVSFFNLIPCCYVCNSNLKRNQEFTVDTHIHPYKNGFGDLYQFTVQFKGGKNLDYLKNWYSNPDVFSIDFKVNEFEKCKYTEAELKVLIKRIENNKKTFKLKSLYNSHTDYVGEILLKSLRYDESKINSLCQEFPKLFPSKYDVVRVVYSNYVDATQLDRRALSKLTRDITQEFGMKYI